jgi:hypothetical protein
MLRRTFAFTSNGIYRSHSPRSTFWCVWARNVDALFFMLEWDWYGFDKKRTKTRYAELVVLHAVRPGRETLTQYFSCLGGTGTDSTKCAS